MTRVTSIGYKKKTYLPSDAPAENPYGAPQQSFASSSNSVAVRAPTVTVDDGPRPIAKLPKNRRGTRGKKDKRGKKEPVASAVVEGGAVASAASAEGGETSVASTSTPVESTEGEKAEGGEVVIEEYVGKQDGERAPDGRLTMAGLKGPKPGETATEHAARMQKKEAQKLRRENGTSSFVVVVWNLRGSLTPSRGLGRSAAYWLLSCV